MNNLYFNQKSRRKLNGLSAAVIKYDNDLSNSPTIVAQGKGAAAQKILELAKQNHVHLQEDSALLHNLLDIDLGDSVPPQLYGVIAEIFILLEELEKDY